MEVNQPYINKTLQDPAKVESNEVGKLIDEIAGQVKDPNIRNSLISQSAKYKFKATNGLANRTYADTKSGIFKRVGNAVGSTIKGIFNRSKNKPQIQQNAVAQQNKNNVNQQGNGNQTQQSNQNSIAPNSNANQSNQQNAVARQNQNNTNQQSQQVPTGTTLLDHLNQKMANRNVTGAQYVSSQGLDRLANSTSRNSDLASDMYDDQMQQVTADTGQLRNELQEAKRRGDKAKVKELGDNLKTIGKINGIQSDMISQDLDHNTVNSVKNDLRDYYKVNNQDDIKNDSLWKRSDDYFANQLKALSNKRMINLDNIRFFSENTQEFVIKMYADSLTEEEMQSALKRKKLKNKVLNVLKTIGKVGLAGAALYGGAKWLKNGGKDYVNKLMDKSSDFVSKTGDAAIETAKGVKDDTKDEVNRTIDELAKQRLSGSSKDNSDNLENPNTPEDIERTKLEIKDAMDQRDKDELNKRLAEIDQEIHDLDIKINERTGYGNVPLGPKTATERESYIARRNELEDEKTQLLMNYGASKL